jgi:AraC-like DNA-binding protein/tetratricopeptide (TPR) repeat protein
MKRPRFHFFSIIIIFLCELLFAQEATLSEFYLIQRQYENMPENDSSALPLINELIKKAKVEKDQKQLFLGYKDARYYTPSPHLKLKYADSAIFVAAWSKNDSLLSSAHLSKGVVYYFYLKKYQPALDEYIKAYEKIDRKKEPYYSNKVNYHIGVVKSYIGYYDDALKSFKETKLFFEQEIKRDLHPNLMYGNLRGYYNTLHQMAVCYRNLGEFNESDSLVVQGKKGTWKNQEFKQEYSYFLKEEGISQYRRKNYEAAIVLLQSSLQELITINDFAWLAVSYAYLGKAKLELGREEEGIKDYEKVDSIFTRHSFLHPENRSVYEELIKYYNSHSNSSKALYYTLQLIEADKILNRDFVYLSSKIHKEFDTNNLLEEKLMLQRKISMRGWIIVIVAFLAALCSLYLVLYIGSRRKSLVNNNILGIKIGGRFSTPVQDGTYRIRHYSRIELQQDTVKEILVKLSHFESNFEFINPETDLRSLAKRFGVSSSYLSNVINEHKRASFNRYLSELRINYITEKISNDPVYRKYNSATLAKECGIASRTNFSALFKEINGISFAEFISKYKMKKEVDEHA